MRNPLQATLAAQLWVVMRNGGFPEGGLIHPALNFINEKDAHRCPPEWLRHRPPTPCRQPAVVTFEEIEANPLRATVMRGAAAAAREACDFVVALGGGSCIDAAKAVAAMAVNPGDLWDYMEWGTGGHKPFSCRPLPIVSIPTTAGTGSEIDPWGAILNEDTNEKISMGNDLTRPVLAIIDPELNRSVPAKFTAYQGFDALFHASERYASKFANYLSDLFALEAIRHPLSVRR